MHHGPGPCWLALALVGCSTPGRPPSLEGRPEDGRWPACDPEAQVQTISFVHVNDLHAGYTPHPADGVSPVARMRGYLEQVATEHNPYTLFTDAGDDHEKGSVAELLSEGEATRAVTEALRFDLRSLGNHDFAWGEEAAMRFSRDPHAVVLASNTSYEGPEPEAWGAVRYAQLELGCVTLGFFGFVSPPWDECNEPSQGDFFPGGALRMRYDYAELARGIVAEHGSEVDLMVMISHLGGPEDAELAARVPGIDLVLGGHSHHAVERVVQVGETRIVQAGSDGLLLAHLDLDLDLRSRAIVGQRYQLLPVLGDAPLPVDAATQQAVASILARYAPQAHEPIAWLHEAHDPRGVAALTAQAAREVMSTDAALVDSATVWRAWPPGPLGPQDLADTYKVERQPPGTPSWNAFARVEIRGAALQAIASALPEAWAYAGPERPLPDQRYSLALQRCGATHPERNWPGLHFDDPTELTEAWELLARYGAARQAQGLYLDVDQPLPR